MKKSDAIGIFDSGLGGISMLCTLSQYLPLVRANSRLRVTLAM